MPDKEEEVIQEAEKPEGTPRDLMEDSEDIIKQIKTEIKISESYKEPIRKKWIRQMKMMNNEKLNNEKIGDETMWTIFNTVQSSLDNDKLLHDFVPTEKGDEEICELMNNVATHHYNKMECESVERVWNYWSLFAGRAVIDQSEYNEKILSCVPKVINPFLEYVDPRAVSMHGIGITGEGSARWYGYELQTTIGSMKDVGINVEKNSKVTSQAIQDMNESNGIKNAKASGDNEDVVVYVWYTKYNGKHIRCLVDSGLKKIYKVTVLKSFPLADRSTNISPLSWYPRSIPDLLEDKHRAKANIINISHELVREQLKPIYLVKEGTVDLRALENAEANDILEVQNIDGVKPMQKQSIVQDVDWLLNILDSSAQEVSATPDIQQGVMMDQKRTASELNLVASGVKNRYGMTARIFGGSMRKLWENWYLSIQDNFDEGVHSMMIRISGVYGPSWRQVQKRDITLAGDLDIRIESKTMNDQKQAIERNNFMEFHAVASRDPTYDIREGIKIIGKKSGITTQEINFLLRKTTDEMEAEEENKLLSQNKLGDGKKAVVFNIRQDHDAHIREHMKAEDTEATRKHIEVHYEAKMFAKNNPDIMGFIGQNMNEGDQAYANSQDQSIGKMVNTNQGVGIGLPTF